MNKAPPDCTELFLKMEFFIEKSEQILQDMPEETVFSIF